MKLSKKAPDESGVVCFLLSRKYRVDKFASACYNENGIFSGFIREVTTMFYQIFNSGTRVGTLKVNGTTFPQDLLQNGVIGAVSSPICTVEYTFNGSTCKQTLYAEPLDKIIIKLSLYAGNPIVELTRQSAEQHSVEEAQRESKKTVIAMQKSYAEDNPVKYNETPKNSLDKYKAEEWRKLARKRNSPDWNQWLDEKITRYVKRGKVCAVFYLLGVALLAFGIISLVLNLTSTAGSDPSPMSIAGIVVGAVLLLCAIPYIWLSIFNNPVTWIDISVLSAPVIIYGFLLLSVFTYGILFLVSPFIALFNTKEKKYKRVQNYIAKFDKKANG